MITTHEPNISQLISVIDNCSTAQDFYSKILHNVTLYIDDLQNNDSNVLSNAQHQNVQTHLIYYLKNFHNAFQNFYPPPETVFSVEEALDYIKNCFISQNKSNTIFFNFLICALHHINGKTRNPHKISTLGRMQFEKKLEIAESIVKSFNVEQLSVIEFIVLPLIYIHSMVSRKRGKIHRLDAEKVLYDNLPGMVKQYVPLPTNLQSPPPNNENEFWDDDIFNSASHPLFDDDENNNFFC
jgi:hypothetical protein